MTLLAQGRRLQVAIGIGCDRGTGADTIARAVGEALAAAGLTAGQVAGVASVTLKADEAGLLAWAERQGLAIRFYAPEQLDAITVPNPSPTVRRHIGCASIAEAAALLAAGTDASGLLVEKHRVRDADGKHVTVSIARIARA